jgi:hypothetical protein
MLNPFRSLVGRTRGVEMLVAWLTMARGSPGRVRGGRDENRPPFRSVALLLGLIMTVTRSPSCEKNGVLKDQ